MNKLVLEYKDWVKVNEVSRDDKTKYWAIFPHIYDYFAQGNSFKEVDKLLKELPEIAKKNPRGWPVEAVHYFVDVRKRELKTGELEL